MVRRNIALQSTALTFVIQPSNGTPSLRIRRLPASLYREM